VIKPTDAVDRRRLTIEPSVSSAHRTAQRFAATATPIGTDPDGVSIQCVGMRVWPPVPLQPLSKCVDLKFAPFAQVGLPRSRLRGAQARGPGASWGIPAVERPGAGSRHHAIRRLDLS